MTGDPYATVAWGLLKYLPQTAKDRKLDLARLFHSVGCHMLAMRIFIASNDGHQISDADATRLIDEAVADILANLREVQEIARAKPR